MSVTTTTKGEPLWLQEFVELSHRKCESHPPLICYFFCIKCIGRAFCQRCKIEHDQCGERNILQTFKASGEAAVRTEEMKTLCDISDVCDYIRKGEKIVFIHKKGRNCRAYRRPDRVWCGNCSYLINPDFKYCSIECKMRDIWREEGETNADANLTEEIDQEGKKMMATTPTEDEPLWLQELVSLGHFYRNCESHPFNLCYSYCIKCMGRAFCRQCKSEHDKCGGQNILNTLKVSEVATLRTEEMKKVWDVSDICTYICNGNPVVFIRKNRPYHGKCSSHDQLCQNCSHLIKRGVKYCSIECKMEGIKRKRGEKNAYQEDAKANSTVEVKQEDESSAHESHSERPREEIPHTLQLF